MSYIGQIPLPQATEERIERTATAGQTSFTGLTYVNGHISVYLNGIKLDNADITATDGTTVTLATGAAAGDTVSFVSTTQTSALVALPLKDSSGAAILSESGSTVTLANVDTATIGSNALVVDSSGNVGIGTSAPVAPLQIDSNAAGDTPLLRLNNKNNTNGDTCNILFGFAGNNNANKGGIFFKRTNSFGRGDLIFATENSASNDNVDNSDAKLSISSSGSVSVAGSFSKGSGSFKINHPLPSKSEHHLVHSFIEGPRADLIYRGKSQLVNGLVTVNIDSVSGMTEGTFVLLNREVQCFTSNESGWINVRGSVSGNILTIEAEDNTSSDTISWLIIGERQDDHMYDTDWTDENGKVVVEPLKRIEALETT